MSAENLSQKEKIDQIVKEMVDKKTYVPKNPSYDFTIEDLDTLAASCGKEKKKLLKELKKKYEKIKKSVD